MFEGRMALAAAPGQSATISVPKARGRKQCMCCPYGYHIDLDFVRYCEAISNSELLPRRTEKMRPRRNKTPSMDVLLGIQQWNFITGELYCDYPQSLKLKRSSKRRNMFYQNKKQETTEFATLL
ncbi:hypothetical protein AAG570_012924 [Ranatra chinensis]|uniref:Uncharacterized protein n=1 Tax=Ranatra chinensis TaxID=642074 RepID=A0ABD0YFA4_9HEMI